MTTRSHVHAGIDGCKAGWLAVIEREHQLTALIAADLTELFEKFPNVWVGIDIPIGLSERGARQCDLGARRLLGSPRASSVFPAPIRGCLKGGTYRELCSLHETADGRRLTKQTFFLLPKIGQIDELLTRNRGLIRYVREVHPEVSFAFWQGKPMRFNKRTQRGRLERERLIEREWPGERARLARELQGGRFAADDLNDAFAALWSARRIAAGRAQSFPSVREWDGKRLPMRIEV